MLYDETAVRANIRNRQGKRVFFLKKEDTLTSSARDWLSRERIQILPAEQGRIETYRLLGGGMVTEKPEHMTHLHSDVLVPKNHRRIRLRGGLDSLEGELLLCKLKTGGETGKVLGEILALVRRLVRCEVLSEAVGSFSLGGLTQEEQRRHSHFPQEFYGQPHFMPEAEDGERVLLLNRCRSKAREVELLAVDAFLSEEGLVREDIVKALNRVSSMLYILMIREKGKKDPSQGAVHPVSS